MNAITNRVTTFSIKRVGNAWCIWSEPPVGGRIHLQFQTEAEALDCLSGIAREFAVELAERADLARTYDLDAGADD